MKLNRCDIGEWRRYRNPTTLAVIAIHMRDRAKVSAIAGFARLSFPITRDQAAKHLRAARSQGRP